MVTHQEIVDQTLRARSSQLAQSVTANSAILARLKANQKRIRQPMWVRAKWWVGGIFLRIANGLGAYNDGD